jgi:hypothetical protein
MSSERSGLRERVRRAIAGPVAESEKLLADLQDADAKTSLSILVSGWFRGVAAALEELAIAVDSLLEQPPAEATVATRPSAESQDAPSQASPTKTPERVDLTDTDEERLIDAATKSREETAKLQKEAEQARRRLEQ